MFDNDLVVMEEFVSRKRIEDYEFKDIPIWIRVYGLPLGDMDEDTGEMIGNMVGEFVEADTRADGRAIGKYLRVKVRLQIGKPLMRGFTLDEEAAVGEERDNGKADMVSGDGEEERKGSARRNLAGEGRRLWRWGAARRGSGARASGRGGSWE